VTVVIEGGHGEVFVQPFAADPLRETAPLSSVSRDDAVILGARAGDMPPDACNAVLLANAPLPVRPIYGRSPDAKPMVV
jgi:tRNA threonylcarbamoyladenosine biosynthesis protein TsaB